MKAAPITFRPKTPAALAALAATLGVLALAGTSFAGNPATQVHHVGWDQSADGRLVDVQVLVQGSPTPLYIRWDQRDRLYLQAFKGRNYSLRIRNNTGERIGVLIAVDGLNVVNGERSGLASGEPMYVLGPWQTSVIRGWRTSLDEIRRFVFVDEERSYAERTGQANGEMGWIRVLSFREQRPLAWSEPWYERNRLDGGSPAPRDERASAPVPQQTSPPPTLGREGAQKAAPEARPQEGDALSDRENFPGTGWGDRSTDRARRVQFDPEALATDHLVLRYEYESGLRALGIFPERRYRLRDREDGRLGFAQPPRW